MIIYLHRFTFAILLAGILFTASFAQAELKSGIDLFNSGKNKEAVAKFKMLSRSDPKNPEVWNYLGLAYMNSDDVKNGRKAFEKAVKLNNSSTSYLANLAYANLLSRKLNKTQDLCHKALEIDPNNANAYYIRGTSYLWERQYKKALADAEMAIKLRPTFLQPYVLQADALLYDFGDGWAKAFKESDKSGFVIENISAIEQALDILRKCESACEKGNDLEFLLERKAGMNAFLDYFRNHSGTPDPGSDAPNDSNLIGLKIISKPRPGYTNSARAAGVQGVIFLSAVFDADSTIKHVFVLKGLGNGLDQQAIAAARKIEFEPARRDGNPYSVVKIIQYNFTIY
ncbi:MAG: TonB family protein [Acidobacteria bacterium]|nr:TonB family protein [Acidobacteriota bacterium]